MEINMTKKLTAILAILKIEIGLEILCDLERLKNILRAINEAMFMQ